MFPRIAGILEALGVIAKWYLPLRKSLLADWVLTVCHC